MWTSVSVQCNNLEWWHDLPYLLEKLHSLKQYANGSWNSSSNHLKKKQVLELTLRSLCPSKDRAAATPLRTILKLKQGLECTLRSLCPSKDRLASVWTRKFVRVVCKPDSHARMHWNGQGLLQLGYQITWSESLIPASRLFHEMCAIAAQRPSISSWPLEARIWVREFRMSPRGKGQMGNTTGMYQKAHNGQFGRHRNKIRFDNQTQI